MDQPTGNGSSGLDDLTVEAATILAEAVREGAVPGVLEFRTIGGALDRAIASRSAADLKQAGAVFNRLEGEVREDIADRAYTKAKARRRGRRGKSALVAAFGRVKNTD